MDQITLYNMALSNIGTRTSVSSLTEDSTESNACDLWYDFCRRDLLQAAHWNFARKQVSLALLADSTLTPPQAVPVPWVYEYAFPPDCLLMRNVLPTIYTQAGSSLSFQPLPATQGPVRFIKSSDQDSNGNPINVILTNQPNAIGVYTFDVTNPNNWDSKFTVALTNLLAARLAIALTGDKSLAKMQWQLANESALSARASDGNEGFTVIDHMPDWIRIRGYAGDWAYPDGGILGYGPAALTLIV